MRSTGAIGIWLEAGCEDRLIQSPCVPLIRDAVMCVRSGVDLVAYAAHNLVALYDPDAQAVVATLRGHELAVNSVAWLSKCDRYRCTCAVICFFCLSLTLCVTVCIQRIARGKRVSFGLFRQDCYRLGLQPQLSQGMIVDYW